MVEPIQQMEEEVESIVEKHQLEEMERVSVAPKDTEEDDIEPPSSAKTDTLVKSELQKSNLAPIAKTLEVFSENWETCEKSLASNTLDKDPLLEVGDIRQR